ncbi:hypothetical protein [Fluviicola chungangensis]|uniref:Uncharacterized protein n=1 Tax=Fluviicola chungangensis TaxID=2597671 RepID=A0A556MNV0_9FLAO|nr:hypothetical protein [Fluviicola chungangensis]TSJ41641.1 hypothetical protein FO442_14375 [Fluviicola chungangensis]
MPKHFILLVFSTISCFPLWAQTTSSSPYSTAGIGEEGTLPEAQYGGMGTISGICFDSTLINTYNPSGYSTLSFGQPLFSVGVSSKFSTYSSNAGSFQGKTTGISNITMAIPMGKYFGIGLGLKPFTRKGYDLSQRSYAYDDSTTFNYKGYGSTNLLFVGLAYSIIKNDKSYLSIGFNLGYLFGSVTNQRSSVFDANSPGGGVDMTTYRLKSLHYSFGASYQRFLDIDKRKQLFLSAVYTPQISINAYRDYSLFYATDVNNQLSYTDTVSYIDNNKGKIVFPSKQTIGAGYTFSPDTKLSDRMKYQLGVFAEVDLMQWKSYAENFDNHASSAVFTNTFVSKIGLQYIPTVDVTKKAKGIKYFTKIKYRIGGQYGLLPNTVNGRQLKTTSATIGFGFPFLSQKSNSSLNISFQYGSNATGNAADLKERFFSFNFGIIIAPSSYEKWFKKYKLD